MKTKLEEYRAVASDLLQQAREEHPKEHFMVPIYLVRMNLATTPMDRERVLKDLIETVSLMLPVGEVIQECKEDKDILRTSAIQVEEATSPLLAYYVAGLCRTSNPIA
jgi:hypothetical protein